MEQRDPSTDGKNRGGLADVAKTYVQVEKIAQIGLVLPSAVLIGWLGGTWLDSHLHQSWMAITGFLLGCIAGMTSAIRMAMAMVADPAKKRNRRDSSGTPPSSKAE
jgi:F0F1-type ATP synthase assembly protein I